MCVQNYGMCLLAKVLHSNTSNTLFAVGARIFEVEKKYKEKGGEAQWSTAKGSGPIMYDLSKV